MTLEACFGILRKEEEGWGERTWLYNRARVRSGVGRENMAIQQNKGSKQSRILIILYHGIENY